MNCKETQNFIITDYVDGQMGALQKDLIDRHLAHCPACQGYLNSIRNEAINPFIKALKDVPDQTLWAQIRLTIDEQQQHQLEKALKPGLWEKFRSIVHMPRPAIALATFVTMIFVIGFSGQLFLSSPVAKIKGQDQVAYLSSLIDEPVGLASNNGNDSQTPIEQYFL